MHDRTGMNLLEGLERGDLESLDHEGHVMVAWALSRRHPLVEVLRRLPRLLRAFAASKGHEEAYDQTMTFAYICLIHERVKRSAEPHDWETFRDAHPELFDRGLLERY